jgi:hypothetical protein
MFTRTCEVNNELIHSAASLLSLAGDSAKYTIN